LKPLVAFLDDLFFRVKIADAAKRAGRSVEFLQTEDALVQRVAQEPSIVILDVNCSSSDSIKLATRLKTLSPTTTIIGFVSHVQTELRKEAEQSGFDVVLARSVFANKLPDLLRQS
jgi:CheY-like chemotaxis protein